MDIEDWYHVPSVTGSPFSTYRTVDDFFGHWNRRYDYLTKPTMRVLDLLDDHEVTATFFIVADVVERYAGLVEAIAERGHEIACHGLHHGCCIDPETRLPLITEAVFEERTLAAKAILEKQIRGTVSGYRAPSAFVAGWMLDALERLGFLYDSSVSANSVYNKTDSDLAGVGTQPYYPVEGSLVPGGNRRIVEFPFPVWDVAGVRVPAGGGPILRFLGSGVVLRGLRQSLAHSHTLFYFHPLDIAREDFPAIGRKRPFYWLVKGDRIERRIQTILKELRDFPRATLGEVRRGMA